jgi:hypothetical protein
MPRIHVLRLTDAQAEICGYALTLARRARINAAERARKAGKRLSARTAMDQAERIEEVRELLDHAPIEEE